MNSEKRAFPVIIDPQITVPGSYITTYGWENGNLFGGAWHTVGVSSGNSGNYDKYRMYMVMNVPTIACNPRIKKAELTLTQYCNACGNVELPKLGIFEGQENLDDVSDTNYGNLLIDYEKVKVDPSGENGQAAYATYTFDITQLVDKITRKEDDCVNLLLKIIDEEENANSNVSIFASGNGEVSPQLCVTYESSYGVNTSYRNHTHELGRFGHGSVDLQCGNLMLEAEAFAWSGNRMPVSIKHLYNSALSDYQYTENSGIGLNVANFDRIKLGYGWKLNVMQSIMPIDFQYEGNSYSGYVYIGESGEETYFRESEELVSSENAEDYYLYEDVTGNEMQYDPEKRTLIQGEDTYLFDTDGRLVRITDEYGNYVKFNYVSGLMETVTDGAGRVFRFVYDGDGFITSITAPDGTSISYSYTGNSLTGITYPDGTKAIIGYSENKPAEVILQDENGQAIYKVTYSFKNDFLYEITEYGVEESAFVTGASYVYEYSAAAKRTIVHTTEQMDTAEGETEDNIVKTVYGFDEEGNVISEYVYSEDTGNTGVNKQGSGICLYSSEVGLAGSVNNLLSGHNFNDLTSWTALDCNEADFNISNSEYESYANFSKKMLVMNSYNSESIGNGMYQETMTLPSGTYTFSAYMKICDGFSGTEHSGAYIRVTDTLGNTLAESEHMAEYGEAYVRLVAPFEIAASQKVKVHVLADGKGSVFVDAAQLEDNTYANPYNMLENGNFESESLGWIPYCASRTSETSFNMEHSLKIECNLRSIASAYQDVAVRTIRSERETFTLSGWAKGYGLSNRERDGLPEPQFRLRAVLHYYDEEYGEYGEETYTADFSTATEEWQFASVEFEKSKYRRVDYVRVYCDYDYNWGTAYFDDIQLVRNSLEKGLTEDDFVVEDTDTSEDSSGEGSTEVFEEAKDEYGNVLTETIFNEEETAAIYRSFGYNNASEGAQNAGNDLVCETDARGYKTQYIVDEETSRNTEIIDRCGNRTAYEYDKEGKTTKVTSKDAENNEIANVSYSYDSFDNMTEIVRGDGMKYVLVYNAFHNLESIGIDGKSERLVAYTYKNGNGRLKQITYANGDVMKVTYNSIGQMNSEKWYNALGELTAHYKYVYDGSGDIVRSIDLLGKKEYDYVYENGRIVRAVEYDIAVNESGLVISKSVVNTVFYGYDSEDKLSSKRIIAASGLEKTISYNNTNEDSQTLQATVGTNTMTSSSVTDSFGRKTEDKISYGDSNLSHIYYYQTGQVTDEHKAHNKIKGSATTELVSSILISNGRTLSYVYDEEERIIQHTDKHVGWRDYVYDAQGQLTKEFLKGELVNEMTYDKYGNILSKNGIVYTYGDSVWKDRLTAYGDKTISYDAQGNPTSYLGYRLVWEKGRQLKRFHSVYYTYNANGIRTSKTVNGVKHTYTLDGTNILRETWGNNVLIPLHDSAGSVFGIVYNNEPYYFQKNLQGDVIGITNKNVGNVAEYTYDAWGVCTIVSDGSECGIASINPYRYRGYYYDTEIKMYYLQSRYYDPVVGRFLNADAMIDAETISGGNLFIYCDNNPIMYIDTTGYGKTYVIYYNNPKSGFYKQAMNSPYYNRKSKKVCMLSVISNKDFIDAWNSMRGAIDYIYLYLHGGKGVLYFKGESLGFSGQKNFGNLKSKKVKKRVYLFSCKGGAGKEGNNVAWMFAKLTHSKVYACTGSVSYSKIFGKYYARKAWDLGIFKTFYYQKRYIFWGNSVARSVAGEW